MKEKIIILKREDQETLGSIRTFPNLFIATDKQKIWLKGIPLEKANAPIIQSLPAIESYYLDNENRLFPIGKKTPVGKLEEKEWQTIKEFLEIELPTSLLPGKTNKKYEIKIKHTEEVKESVALLTDLRTWKTYAETASIIRLEKLKYAVSENNEVLIIGKPLPTIPGQEFWQRKSILIPNGKDFEFSLVASLLLEEIETEKGDIILFQEKFTKISQSEFQKASRSSIRKTQGNHG